MKIPLLVMIIMDGYGVRQNREGNAILLAGSPNIVRLQSQYPSTTLKCSGNDVGLPAGLMGNSEVGHLNIGAGRIVWQEITKIDNAIADGSFFTNPALVNAMTYARQHNSKLHLIGLVSDGGVHSSDRHYLALLDMAKSHGFTRDNLCFHAVMDGRDTPPDSGVNHIAKVQAKMDELNVGRIATINGRYWLMDRDKRWDRVELAYNMLTLGAGVKEESPSDAIKNAYARKEMDEFIKPIVICQNSQPLGIIKDNDSIIFFNFRADRAREMTRALTEPDFTEFPRAAFPKVFYTTMTLYDEHFTLPIAFKPVSMKNILGEILGREKIRQLRIAETEKYAHVTYFFNGGEETPFPYEDRQLIPSPKVATYDLQPQMNAPAVTQAVLKDISANAHQIIIMNFANCDMVGHTGVISAAIKAVQTVDDGVGQITNAALGKDGIVLITADHGNCEEMIDYAHGNQPHTYHTTNLVPLILAGEQYKARKLQDGGRLCDIAPTILEIIDVPQPAEMDGHSLLTPE